MSQNNNVRRKLQSGVQAIRNGDRATGRRLLQDVIRSEPDNEVAWMWLASAVTTLSERREALERVLEINPDNTRAREALQKLNEVSSQGDSAEPRRPAAPTPAPEPAAGGNRGFSIIILALLVIIAVVAGVLIFPLITGDDGGDDSGSNAAAFPTPTQVIPTNTPLPTTTVERFDGQSGAPTLPPTFTPTPSPEPTNTATPTQTPIPVESFTMLYTSLESGDVQPMLYRLQGDGEGELLGRGIRDIAYDPSGEMIAFIRDVNYDEDDAPIIVGEAESTEEPDAEASNTFPELFIAPVDDLDAAQQVTELRTNLVASPTWSPEGDELVFVADFDGTQDLWYITPDGENLRRLTTDDAIERDPSWSPILGSREIVFASDMNSFGSLEIFLMEVPEPNDDPAFTQLTNANGSSYAPAWSDNGNRIVFISNRRNDPDVYIMNPNGSDEQILTENDANAEDRAPTFTPDGRFVAFISNRQDDRFQTYLISLDGAVLVRLTENPGNDTSVDYRPELILRLQD